MGHLERLDGTIPFIKREVSGMCGPGALHSLCSHFGITTSQEELATLAQYRPDWGTPQLGMVKAAKAKGLSVLALRNTTLDVLDLCLGNSGVAIVNYMDREPDGSFNPIEDGNYAVYLGRSRINNLPEVHLMCSYRGKYKEPEHLFVHYWWDLDLRGGGSILIPVHGWAMLAFPDKASLKDSLQTLSQIAQ